MARDTGGSGPAVRALAAALAALAAQASLAACSTGSPAPAAAASPSITADCVSPGTPLAKRVVHFASADHQETVEAYVRTPFAGSGGGARAKSPGIGIVIDHQSSQSLCDSMGWADQFAAEGYLAVAPSLDDGSLVTETEGAVAYLRAHGATQIVLLGASMGGTTVLATAAKLQPPVQAVISVSGPTAYAMADAGTTAPDLTVPVFYSAGAGDTDFAQNETDMYNATKEKDKVLDIVPVTDQHGFDLLSSLMTDIDEFIQKYTH